jgi:rhamnosyltransferase
MPLLTDWVEPGPEAHKAPSICSIVVTYYPNTSVLGQLLRAIRPQVGAIVVVDNGSPETDVNWLYELDQKGLIAFLPLGENLGIAYAHNRGIEWAEQCGYSHVLVLDQDSVPASNMVERLMDASVRLRGQGIPLAAVGPRWQDAKLGYSSFFFRFGAWSLKRTCCDETNAGNNILPVDFLMSSGSLISLEALRAIGPMDESLFIDCVDIEWILRARARGYKAFGACDALMEHSLGHDTIPVWLWRWRYVPIHSPLRHYYVFRNTVLLFRRRCMPVKWMVNDIVRLAKMFCFYCLFTPPRWQQLSMMLKGLWHGIKGRSGKYG